MPSTHTTRNRLEKQAAGENNNTWGALLNTNTIDMTDQALDGMTSFTLSGSKTLSTANGTTDEARCRYINITGGTGGTVTIPNLEKVYIVRNESTGTVTFTTGSGTTCTVTTLTQAVVVCEAGNVCRSYPIGTTLPSLTVKGNTTISGAGVRLFVDATDSESLKITFRDASSNVAHIGTNGDGVFLLANAAGATLITLSSAIIDINSASGVLKVNGTQVMKSRITGWGAPSGTATRTTFDTATVTTELLAQRVKALIDDLTTHGMIGT